MPGKQDKASFLAIALRNQRYPLEDDKTLGRLFLAHGQKLLFLVVVPGLAFIAFSCWFGFLTALGPGLHASPSVGGDALGEVLCTSGSFGEGRMVWGAAAAATVLTCVALTFYAAYSMQPYFARPRVYWYLIGLIIAASLGTAIALKYVDGRVYSLVFPRFLADALTNWSCAGDRIRFFEYFDKFFDFVNFLLVLMCLTVASCLVFTATNASEESEIGFLRRQRERLRTLLYLGSVALVVGVWHVHVWGNWPVTVFEDLRARAEKTESEKAAKLQEGDAERKALLAKDRTSQPDDKTKLDALARSDEQLRAERVAAGGAKAKWEARKKAAESTARGFVAFFAVLYSLLLVTLFVPAGAILQRALRRHAETESAKSGVNKPPDKWLEEQGLAIDFLDQLKPVVALIAPVLAASVGAAFTALVGK